MRILHVVWGFSLGGVETMLTNIANYQSLSNNVNILIINDIVNQSLLESLSKNVRVIKLKRKIGSKSIIDILKLNWNIHFLHPDIIHLHDRKIIKYIVPYFRNKCCVTMHNSLFKNTDYSDLKKFKRVFSISKSVEIQLLNNNIQNICIPNGIPLRQILYRNHFSIGKIIHAVQVSRLFYKQKGQDLLLKALSIALHKYRIKIILDFIGEGEDMNYLKEMAVQLDINDNVNFLGARPQHYIFTHLKDYDLFIQPSYYEGFGLTVAEAIAAKVPVLVSNNEGPLEIIDNGKYGFYFLNGNAEDCAKRILQFTKEIKNIPILVEQAYSHISKYYSVDRTAQTYLDEYKKMNYHE